MTTSSTLQIKNGVSLTLALLFTDIGGLNLVLIGIIPGLYYLAFSLLFYPRVNHWLYRKSKFKYLIPCNGSRLFRCSGEPWRSATLQNNLAYK